ncbi:hypothetical protein I5E97_05595 [Proteus hauseri]|nr:hypothetical protein [Proteus hauseri]MBG6030523.1 hypothetical protein [Proteus hauseri]
MTKTTATFNFGNGSVDIEGTKGEYKDAVLSENEFSIDPSWWRLKEENDKLHSGEITADDICRKYQIG